MTDHVQWRLLPTKLHRQMEQAGADAAQEYMAQTGNNNLFVIYEAMVAAAPAAPPSAAADADRFRKALDLIGAGLIIGNGSENTDAIRMEIHALQERDLDQLGLLIESREMLVKMASIERRHGAHSSAEALNDLAARIHANVIAPITEGRQPPKPEALNQKRKMPRITVTTSLRTVFEVPEGVTIDQVRHLALPVLSEAVEETDALAVLQQTAIGQIYLGDATDVYLSVEHTITDGEANGGHR